MPTAVQDPARPRATIVLEWENAPDAGDAWVRLSLERLEAEIERVAASEAPPPVLCLYQPAAIERSALLAVFQSAAPRLAARGSLSLLPVPGLTYYEMKSYGAQRAETEFVIFLDSDTGPLPGWYAAILAPLHDPAVVAVGGMTVLGLERLWSRIFAPTWFFPLAHEGERAERRQRAHANNLAVRRDRFLQHPFPVLPAFKQAHTLWQEQMRRAGWKLPVAAAARTVHAPPASFGYWPRRAWHEGGDRDFTIARRYGAGRLLRLLLTPAAALRALGRGLWRIFAYGHRVRLPLWAYPLAVLAATAYQLWASVAQVTSVCTRSPARLRDAIAPTAAPQWRTGPADAPKG